MVDVFDAIATKELVVGAGSKLIAPTLTADDLLIFGGSDGGLTIETTTTGNIYFADAAHNSIGGIQYNHASDRFSFTVGSSGIMLLTNDRTLELKETSDNTPSMTLSGAIFISGGGLWYKGFAGTYKELAVA